MPGPLIAAGALAAGAYAGAKLFPGCAVFVPIDGTAEEANETPRFELDPATGAIRPRAEAT